MQTKATKPAAKKATKPAALPKPQILKPGATGPEIVDPKWATLKDRSIEAVRSTESATGKWAALAPDVAEYFQSRKTFEAAYEKYRAECIYPGFSDEERAAVDAVIPNGKTKEGKDPKWAPMRVAKIAVQKKASTYFERIADAAFGKPEKAKPAEGAKPAKGAKGAKGGRKGEGEEGDIGEITPATLKTKTDVLLAALIKAHEKAANGNPAVIKALRAAQAANVKTLDK